MTFFTLYFSINCYEIHVKLIHINFRWIETIIYRVTLNFFLIVVHMFRFCRNVHSDLYFAICNRVCMFNLIFVRVSIRTKCFFNWFIFRFRFVALNEKIYINFDEMSIAIYIFRNLWFHNFRSFVLFDQHMFWNVFHQNVQSEIVCIDVFLFIILFDFQYFRIDFKMFSSKCSIRNCLYDVFFSLRNVQVFVFLINANLIYQK